MGRRRKKGSGGGARLLLLLALLGILGGYGTWNYQRNLAAERAEVRPYRTLSDADLATLIAASEAETEAATRRWEQARGQRAQTAPAPALDAFERAQRRGRAVRELGYRASGHEATLRELHAEQARRAGQGSEWQVFLRRAFGAPPT